MTPNEILTQFSQKRADMLTQLRRVVVGQSDVLEQILAAIFTKGHALLIGVPGLAYNIFIGAIILAMMALHSWLDRRHQAGG